MINISLIYCKISEYTSDKITVAGIFYDDNSVSVRLSQNNLRILKKASDETKYQLLSNEVRALKRFYDNRYRDDKSSLFDASKLHSQLITASSKGNNSIIVQEPIQLFKEMTAENIEILSELYLGKTINLNSNQTNKFFKLKKEFERQTKSYLSFKYQLTDKVSPKLDFPLVVGFAGKNGSLIIGDYLSARLEEDSLLHKVRSLSEMSKNLKDNDPAASIYIISDLINDNTRESIYRKLQEQNEMEMVDSTESNLERLTQSIISKNPIPLDQFMFQNEYSL